MNPHVGIPRNGNGHNWFLTDYFVVEMTTVVGGIIAVIATFLPCGGALNLQHLADDLNSVALEITNVWSDSVLYLTGTTKSAKRFQIESQIDALSVADVTAREHVDGAWWETFDLGTTGRRR